MDYLDGKLDPAQHLEMENHLASCTVCHGFSVKARNALELFKNEKTTEFDPFMLTRIQASLSIHSTAMQHKSTLLGVLQPVLIGIAVFIIVFTGIGIGRSYDYQKSKTRDYATELFYLSEINSGNYESVLPTE